MKTLFGKSIEKLGLPKIHPILNTKYCNRLYEKYANYYSDYQSDTRFFLDYLEDCTVDGLSKEKFFQGIKLYFEIYHTTDINFFWATHFMMDYCKQDMATILNAFKNLNGITKIDNYDIEEYTILTKEELVKIFDIHLIVNLAKIFSNITHCERVIIEANRPEVKHGDFDGLTCVISMFQKEREYYDKDEPNSGFKIYYRKNAALKRAVMFSWKWYHAKLHAFFSMDDSSMLEYLSQNPEIRAVLISGKYRKSNKIKLDRKTIVENCLVEKNFFYLCAILNKVNVQTEDDELFVNTRDFEIDQLMIEI